MSLCLALNGRFLGRQVTGVERLAIELAAALDRLARDDPGSGVDGLDVLTPAGIAAAVRAAVAERLPGRRVQVVGRLSGHAWEQGELARARPDAWLLNLCNTAPIWRRRQALLVCDAQFILHPESYSRAFRHWYRVALTIASRRAAALFTISDFSRMQLERFGVFPRGKAQVLRLGGDHLDRIVADDAVIGRHDLHGPYILATGSLARHKNLAMLVEAFAEARPAGTELVIAGGGNARTFKDAGLPAGDGVRYLGRVTDGELKALYGRALAFACPSLSEGFGFTPLEAMRMGCPVVATTGGAVPETCGKAALYADPLDKAAWRAALARIVADAELRRRLGKEGHARAGSFTWRRAAGQMIDHLADVRQASALL